MASHVLRRARLGASLSIVTVLSLASVGVAPSSAGAATPSRPYVALVEDSDGGLAVKTFRATSGQVSASLREVSRDGDVLSVEVDTPVRALGNPDPYRPDQWALNRISFERSWPATTGAGAVVAVVDTGVQGDHEDLSGRVLPGWDAISDRPGGTTDPHGHGTHVAGIIAAASDNGKGIAGSAPGVRILPVRALDATGAGKSSDILKGIVWAADRGADVINLSVGGPGNDRGYELAVRYAIDKGAVVIAAAGNTGQAGNEPQYPGAVPGVLAVAATTPSDTRAPFSNYGSYVDLAAPGTSILSTVPSGYSARSGTSMATPYVSAAAALVAAGDPGLSPLEIRSRLERSARDLGGPGRDDEFGYGLIDPAAALAVRDPAAPPVPDAPSEPASPGTSGYWVVAADGGVSAFGGAPALGDASGVRLAAPIVAAARTVSSRGYWLVAADGSVYAYGDAAYLGSARELRLRAPIVGMAATPTGRGYWLLGSDGGVFSFGDAGFFGSTGAITLNQPVVDIAPTADGSGYWLVAGDGGVFAFGRARFHGSTGGLRLNRPVVSLTPSATGGYWMVARDGGIFAFDVPFLGSLPGLTRAALPVGARIRATDGGYYILGADGEVFPFGTARDYGSAAGRPAVDLLLAG